ncbi:MAG: glutamate 5-kinase [Chloroflexi bacterium]|nr:glutamate 5-kinase [Chloroflexota bacterium]
MRLVIKIGTSTLTDGTPHLHKQRMLEMVQQIARLHGQGHEVAFVSSGAVAAGRERLGFPELGRDLPVKQMLSAVGQSRLMHLYEDLFDIFGIVVAQVLLSGDDLENRTRRFNARETLLTLLSQRIVPIINENDTTATEEIRVGDNDNLSARVASAIEADALLLVTDQPGLFSADPRHDPGARHIPHVARIDASIWALAGAAGTKQGTGGMFTKLQAAQLATRSGVVTYIALNSAPDVLARVLDGDTSICTRFDAVETHLESRRRWMLLDKAHGVVRVDSGAARALRDGGKSLLPVGITAVEDTFERWETLLVLGPDGRRIAYGLSNYSSDDLRKIRGLQSAHIAETLGYSYGDTVIHRNNMVLLEK